MEVEAEDKSKHNGKVSNREDDAPDGGYGWVIVLAGFLIHIIIGGFDRSDGIFFVEFESRFNKNAALTAWPGALATTVRLALGPVAGMVCETWSERACVMVGAIFMAVFHLLTAFSPNFLFLFVFYGILQGAARSLVYCPALIIISRYFEKRRGFATGLAASGVGMGTVVMVPLVQVVFDKYAFQGGFIVLAGVCLNGLVLAMMCRPLSFHLWFNQKKRSQPIIEEEAAVKEQSVQTNVIKAHENHAVGDGETKTGEEIEAAENSRYDTLKPTEHHPSEDHSNNVRKNTYLKSAFDIIFPRQTGSKKRTATTIKSLFRFDLLGDVAFLCYCISICSFTAAFKASFVFLPLLAESQGLTKSQAIFILSVTGFVDTAGRIISGLIMDLPLVRRWRLAIFCIIMFTISVLSVLIPVVSGSFAWLLTVCCIYGYMTGSIVSQKTIIVLDLLGADVMSNAFGLMLVFQGLGVFAGPSLFGACKDLFGQFYEAFYLGGAMMGVAGCLMVVSAVVHRVKQSKHSVT